MWFGRAKTAAFNEVRRLRDYLIYEHSGIPLQNQSNPQFLVNDNLKVTLFHSLSISLLFL